MAPKGGSGGGGGGGKGIKTTSGGGGGGGGDGDSRFTSGQIGGIALGSIVAFVIVVWLGCIAYSVASEMLQKWIQRRALAKMQGETSVELGQQQQQMQDLQGQPAAPQEPTETHYDKMLYSGSLPETYPTTPAYDTGDLYRPT